MQDEVFGNQHAAGGIDTILGGKQLYTSHEKTVPSMIFGVSSPRNMNNMITVSFVEWQVLCDHLSTTKTSTIFF